MLTSICDETNTKISIQSVIDTISNISSNSSVFLSTIDKKPITQTEYQATFGLKFRSNQEKMIHEIIMNHALTVEKIAASGFVIFLDKLKDELNNHTQTNINYVSHTTPASLSDLDWLLNNTITSIDEKTKQIVLSAISLAGFGGKILVEKSFTNIDCVELINGYTFVCKPAIQCNYSNYKNTKIICIDGVIENVSEIHHILTYASECKETIVIISRGFSNDVKNTIKVNNDRGTLRVIPICVDFNLEGINTIKDIAIVTGSEIISSNKGDLISSISVKDLKAVPAMMINFDHITIVESNNKKNIYDHIRHLLDKRNSAQVEDVIKLYDKRIRSLTPLHVLIKIKNDMNYVIRSQFIDKFLRSYRVLLDHGTITFDEKKYLSAAYYAAQHHVNLCIKTLFSLGCIITNDV